MIILSMFRLYLCIDFICSLLSWKKLDNRSRFFENTIELSIWQCTVTSLQMIEFLWHSLKLWYLGIEIKLCLKHTDKGNFEFIFHSTKNARGVGIIINKKSNFWGYFRIWSINKTQKLGPLLDKIIRKTYFRTISSALFR